MAWFRIAGAVLAASLASPLLAALSAESGGATWYVDRAALGPGDGSFGAPYTHVQVAIDAPLTTAGDTILVAPGLYLERIDFHGKQLAIRAPGGAAVTSLDGSGAGTVVTAANGEPMGTSLSGFRIVGGTGTPFGARLCGGAVYVVGAALALQECELVDCLAEVGSGVFGSGATVELVDCLIADLVCGGGVVVEAGSDLELRTCDLRGISEDNCFSAPNPVFGFGALHARESLVTLEDCRFSDNQAFGDIEPSIGSGATLQRCMTTLDGCVFERHGNSGFVIDMGPAIVAIEGALAAQNSLFHSNRNEFRGGAVALDGVDASFLNCDFDQNESRDDYWGGALYASSRVASTIVLDRCRFVRNQGADGGAFYLGAGVATVSRCAFVSNDSTAFYDELGAGGALATAPTAAHMEVTGSTFVDNRAHGNRFLNPRPGEGGAVFGDITLDRCTLFANRATSDPMAPPPVAGASSGATLRNCIVWRNVPDQLAPGTLATYSEVDGGWPGAGNIDRHPQLWDAEGGDLYLKGNSPCIDAGDPVSLADPDGSRADMGAFWHDTQHCGAPRVVCAAAASSIGCVVRLEWSGSPTLTGPDDFHLRVTNARNRCEGFLRVGPDMAHAPLGNGLVCVGRSARTIPLGIAGGSATGHDCSGTFDYHLTQPNMHASGLIAFETLYAQLMYRDVTYSVGEVAVSETLRFVVCPGP